MRQQQIQKFEQPKIRRSGYLRNSNKVLNPGLSTKLSIAE